MLFNKLLEAFNISNAIFSRPEIGIPGLSTASTMFEINLILLS